MRKRDRPHENTVANIRWNASCLAYQDSVHIGAQLIIRIIVMVRILWIGTLVVSRFSSEYDEKQISFVYVTTKAIALRPK